MGLSIQVGYLADAISKDSEEAEIAFSSIKRMDQALAAEGYDRLGEPTDCEVWTVDMIGYSGLHALREVAAMYWKGRSIPRDTLLDGSQRQHADALAKEFFEHLSGKGNLTLIGKAFRQILKAKEKPNQPPFVHLSIHSDCDGYYVPVPFETPIVPKRFTKDCEHLWPLGSVMRLEAEVSQLACHLEIPAKLQYDDEELHAMISCPDSTPTKALWLAQPIATHACLVLREACNRSLRTGAAIHFC